MFAKLLFKRILPTLIILAVLVLGGVAYTLGAVLYGLGKKKRYMHSLFHVFTVIGSLLQFLCIILYVL